MKHILEKLRWQEMEKALGEVLIRFPLAVTVLGVIAVILLWVVHEPSLWPEEIIFRVVMASLFVLWISIALELIVGSLDLAEKMAWWRWGGTLLGGVAYYLSLPGDPQSISFDFFLTHTALHLALLLSIVFALGIGPWKRGVYQDAHFYNLVITIGLHLVQAVVVGLVFLLAGFASIGSVDLLFEPVWISSKWYAYWLILAGVLVAPLFFLARFPQTMPQELEIGEKFLRFVVRFVAIPFVCIYFGILYAYSVKVLFNMGEWPQGTIVWMVIGFALAGYTTYLLSYHLRTNPWVAVVRRAVPWLLLPQLGMLFYAIILRINQHGWTINRYIVVAFGVWLVLLCLYNLILSHRSHLITIPTSLFITVLFVLVGQWGMVTISERSQLDRLGVLMAGHESLSQAEQASAYSIINYLCWMHGCRVMQTIPAVAEKMAEGNTSAWEINEALGFTDSYHNRGGSNYRYYNFDHQGYDIGGFARFEEVGGYYHKGERGWYFDTETGLLKNSTGVNIPFRTHLQVLVQASKKGENQFDAVLNIKHQGNDYRVFVKNVYAQGEKYEDLDGFIAY